MAVIAAAAALLVVAIAVVAGPSVVSCSQSPDGAVACLGRKLAEAGLLPAGSGQAAAPQGVASTPQPEAGIEAGAGPAITLLRAEPDGSIVIAGTGKPNAQIETYANGELLAAIKAEPSGDWALVPEAPLPAGAVEITVGEAGSAARGERSFVVVIDPGREEEPLVVATRPGEASEVLQGLPPLLAAPAAVPAAPPATADAPTPPEADPPSAGDEPAVPEAAPAPATPPTIDAIEIDGTANFFAGTGAEGATVRLYVDDRHVADAVVDGGRWLVEADEVLTTPSQRVRIDMLRSGTAEVAARAEVDFVVGLPATGAGAAEAAPEAAVAAVAQDIGLAPKEAAHTDDKAIEAAPLPNLAAIEPPPATAERAAEPAAPQAPEPVAEAAAAPPADGVPTLRAVPVGDPEAMRFASGKAIIRHGDNLWSIAQRVYGDGLKYTTIYRANQDQIRSPSRIYPGQVFDLPAVQGD